MKRSNAEFIRTQTPQCLRELSQWVCWRVENRDGKPTKVPYVAGATQRASSTAPADWRTFDEAFAAFNADQTILGVGFVFASAGGFCGVDIDDCRDSTTGEIIPWAQEIISSLASYTEISPSGTGVKIFLRASKPGKKCRKRYESGELEMYDRDRFFTVTGAHLEGTPLSVEARQDELNTLYATVFGAEEKKGQSTEEDSSAETAVSLSDDEIVSLITSSRKGNEKFAALWTGRWNDYYTSPSEADSSLVFKLAYYTKDAAQIDRLFRRCALYRDKWNEPRGDETYGQRTIEKALATVTGQYRPRKRPAKVFAREDIDSLIEKGDVALLFDRADSFAQMDKVEFGKLKARLKEAFGRDLNMTDFTAAVREAKKRIRREAVRASSSLPTIMTTSRQLRDVVEESLQALIAANEPPVLFTRGSAVAVLQNEDAEESGGVHIQSLAGTNTPAMKDHLSRAADFYKAGPEGEDVPCNPPYDVASVILSRTDGPFPPLDGVTRSPVMRADGSILTEPGYDAASRLYYAPAPGLAMPGIPDSPTDEEVHQAVALLHEMVCDFPFTHDACRSNLFALLLSIVMRPLIDGCVPLALIDAPRQGTGKGLLATLVSVVTTGGDPSIMTAPSGTNDDEWRKRITSTLMGGPGVVLLDNVDEPLESPSLAAMLTAREWEDRRLGVSENVRLPVRAVWFGTGNNIQVHGDMPRRCYHIRIDSNLAQPWRRNGFRHPNLREWVVENRGNLLASLLTIARAWCVAGRPSWSGRPLGSFENWCRIVGGTLEHAGVEDFLGNTDSLYEQADEETQQWTAFFSAWDATFGERTVKVRELCSRILPARYDETPSPLRIALPDDLVTAVDKGGGNLARRLGIALRTRRDTVHGAYRLVSAGQDPHDKVMTWKLLPAEQDMHNAHNPAEFADHFAGFAGFEKCKPAAKPASVSPEQAETKEASAGSAGFDLTSLTYEKGLYYKDNIDKGNIYKEYNQKDPANSASCTQHVDNKGGYDCGFGCGSSFLDPADPASTHKTGHMSRCSESMAPPSGDCSTSENPAQSDKPKTQRRSYG